MKPLFPYPITTPPKESGDYFAVHPNGFNCLICFKKDENTWFNLQGEKLVIQPVIWYSPVMPPELAKVLEEVKKQLELHPTTDLFISPQEAQTILKYL